MRSSGITHPLDRIIYALAYHRRFGSSAMHMKREAKAVLSEAGIAVDQDFNSLSTDQFAAIRTEAEAAYPAQARQAHARGDRNVYSPTLRSASATCAILNDDDWPLVKSSQADTVIVCQPVPNCLQHLFSFEYNRSGPSSSWCAHPWVSAVHPYRKKDTSLRAAYLFIRPLPRHSAHFGG